MYTVNFTSKHDLVLKSDVTVLLSISVAFKRRFSNSFDDSYLTYTRYILHIQDTYLVLLLTTQTNTAKKGENAQTGFIFLCRLVC